MYGLVKDPTPDKGRPLRHKAEEREKERLAYANASASAVGSW